LKKVGFWDVALCSLEGFDIGQHIIGSYCLHYQGDECSESSVSIYLTIWWNVC